jgi:hypothetical protein
LVSNYFSPMKTRRHALPDLSRAEAASRRRS